MTPDEIFKKLINQIEASKPKGDVSVIKKAYDFAQRYHNGQFRVSGEEYICHPLQVALIISEMLLDCDTIAAGILHDTIEDTEVTYEDIEQNFGNDIAVMVDGVTKLGKIKFTSQEEAQVENLRKMFMATAKDLRVMLIKLADRLHNLRTMDVMPDIKRRRKAKETIEVFAPIAHRLGMFRIKVELEDLSLKYLDPVAYGEIQESLSEKMNDNSEYIDEIIKTVSSKLKELDIKCEIYGRVKHPYSIFKKTYMKGRTLDEIYDIFAIRVIVESVRDCYAVLGAIHDLYKPIPGRIKDYIAMPKPNLYQSLHTTVLGKGGEPFEIQIRTKEMHIVAEYGIAAHWKYKAGINKTPDEAKFSRLRQMLEFQGTVTDEEEFMRILKTDMFADEVFVFTPKGDVMPLPAGSCPIDFAYSIHSAIGSKMSGARVNGKLVPLNYKLQNGDIVSIITSPPSKGPSRDWLKIVKTSSARTKINQWFKRECRDENIVRGRDMFEKELKKSGYSHSQLYDENIIKSEMERNGFASVDDLFAAIGYGGIPASKIVSKMREAYKARTSAKQKLENSDKQYEHKTTGNGIIIKGIDNCLIRFAGCCAPVPGDKIVGYITRGRGVSVHRADCSNITVLQQGESDRIIEAEWASSQENVKYYAELAIKAEDRQALLADIINTAAEFKISIHNINARTSKELALMNIVVEITSSEQLESFIKKVMGVKGVIEVVRSMQ